MKTKFSPLPDAIQKFRKGQMVIVVDDPDRENEGDIIVPAQFDLSTALGVSGQFEHPEFVAAVARIERAAKSAKIPLCGVAFSRAQAEALMARGYRAICGFDVLTLRAQAAEMRSWLTGPATR